MPHIIFWGLISVLLHNASLLSLLKITSARSFTHTLVLLVIAKSRLLRKLQQSNQFEVTHKSLLCEFLALESCVMILRHFVLLNFFGDRWRTRLKLTAAKSFKWQINSSNWSRHPVYNLISHVPVQTFLWAVGKSLC